MRLPFFVIFVSFVAQELDFVVQDFEGQL